MPPYHSQYYSRSRWSGWSGFSLRFVGALVVFALAALTGAVIGGVSIYLINDAATPPPSITANANKTPALAESGGSPAPAQTPAPQASGATNGRPVRMVDPAFPPPWSVESNTTAPPVTATATQPSAENPVSSAAIPPQPTASEPPAPAQPPPALPQDNLQTTAHDQAAHDAAARDAAAQAAAPETSEPASSPRKVTRKRVTNFKQPEAQATDQAQSATRRTFYDYYDRDNDEQRASAAVPEPRVRGRRGPSQTRQRTVLRQDNYDRDDHYGRDDRDVQSDRRFPAQPQPAQSFFGFFGDRQ